IPTLSNIKDNSLTKEIFTSRCAFSIAFEASATLILGALWVPAVIIERYRSSTRLAISGVEPEVTFLIFVNVLILSHGLIRSGEYPAKKSLLNFNPEVFSKTGTQSSSVQPGYTVDS